MNTEIKIVFSDVDGTLLNSEHRITPRTLGAVKKLGEKGIPFVVVSARSPSGIYTVTRECGLSCPIAAYSGALILSEKGEVLYHNGMKKSEAQSVLDYIAEKGFDLTPCIYSYDEWIVPDKSNPRVIREESIVKASAREGRVSDFAEDEVSKLLCICDLAQTPEIERGLRENFPELSIVKSCANQIEVIRKGVSKAGVVKELCAKYGIPLSEAAAFGDSYNDAEMLETAGKGVLMGNAPSDLKERIPCHTADNDSDGIAVYLEKTGII